MPITPRCQPSPSITSRRSLVSSASLASRSSIARSAVASVSRRSRFSRSSFAASSCARAASRVENSSITSEATSIRPAALMRGARRNATSNPVSCFVAGSSAAAANSARRPSAHRPAQLAQSQRGNHAILSAQRHRIRNGRNRRHLQKTGQRLLARARRIAPLQQRLRQLERDRRAAQRFLGIRTAMLIGIQNRQRARHAHRRPARK